MHKFWMVFVKDAGEPTKRHPTLEEAKTEAERLARKEAPRTVYILETVLVAKTEAPVITWSELDSASGKVTP